eukprot:8188226-Pyramimonas_sp.AAC.1
MRPHVVVGIAIVSIFFGEAPHGVTRLGGTRGGGSTGAVGGAPNGATKRCTGWVEVPNWVSGAHAD